MFSTNSQRKLLSSCYLVLRFYSTEFPLKSTALPSFSQERSSTRIRYDALARTENAPGAECRTANGGFSRMQYGGRGLPSLNFLQGV
jgi:hypothetical protein